MSDGYIPDWLDDIRGLEQSEAFLLARVKSMEQENAELRQAIFNAAAACGFGYRSSTPLGWMKKELLDARARIAGLGQENAELKARAPYCDKCGTPHCDKCDTFSTLISKGQELRCCWLVL